MYIPNILILYLGTALFVSILPYIILTEINFWMEKRETNGRNPIY